MTEPDQSPPAEAKPATAVRAHSALLFLVAWLTYLPAARKGFVSEDFVIFGSLSRSGVWETFWKNLTGPWLDLAIVDFYRPLSTLVLHAEWKLFGLWHPGYVLTHAAIHGLCAVALARLLHSLCEPESDVAAESTSLSASAHLIALLWALHPLHPNAVAFLASFATLFAAALVLAGLLVVLVARRPRAGAVILLLACLCYEQAIVGPALLLLLAVATRRVDWRSLLPALAVPPVFLLLRGAALGVVIGGYSETQDRLESFPLFDGMATLAFQLRSTLWPSWSLPFPWPALAALVLAAAVLALRTRARLAAAGAAWFVLAALPFGVITIVPANGRYLYLSSMGVVLIFWSLVTTPRARMVLLACALPLLLVAGISQQQRLGELQRASVEAFEVADASQGMAILASLHSTSDDPALPVVVLGVPDFLRGRRDEPVAQVLHWGLGDAARPPFRPDPLAVYPSRHLGERAAQPLLRDGVATVQRWPVKPLKTLRPVRRSQVPVCLEPSVETGAHGEPVALRIDAGAVTDADALRLIVLGPLNDRVLPVDDSGHAELPRPTLITSARRYAGTPLFAWIERRSPRRTDDPPDVCTSPVEILDVSAYETLR